MGQYSYSEGLVKFSNDDEANNAYSKFCNWADEKRALKDEDYDIFDIELSVENHISYKIQSMKYENCVWQCEMVRDFFKKQEGCLGVEQNVMVLEDSINWYKGEDE